MTTHCDTNGARIIGRKTLLIAATTLLMTTAATTTFPQVASGGDIKGTVRLQGRADCSGTVVFIDYVDSTFTPPPDSVVMDQKNLMFIPNVLPILAGTKVTFLNSDNVLHNVFTPSQCAGSFDLGTWPKGQSRSYVFTKPDCFSLILCNVHPQMQAWIVVLQNPYFTMVNKAGSFEIRDIPAGRYVLEAWHGFYQKSSAEIVVPRGGTVVKELRLQR